VPIFRIFCVEYILFLHTNIQPTTLVGLLIVYALRMYLLIFSPVFVPYAMMITLGLTLPMLFHIYKLVSPQQRVLREIVEAPDTGISRLIRVTRSHNGALAFEVLVVFMFAFAMAYNKDFELTTPQSLAFKAPWLGWVGAAWDNWVRDMGYKRFAQFWPVFTALMFGVHNFCEIVMYKYPNGIPRRIKQQPFYTIAKEQKHDVIRLPSVKNLADELERWYN
jgi:hypothetical protein